jgi:hypothetical protein
MKVTKIYFQKNYPVGEFQYEHFGVEITIEVGNVDEAFNEAREITRLQWLRYYHQFEDSIKVVEPVKEITVEETLETLSIAEQISSCTDYNILTTYDFILKNHKEYKLNESLRELYNQKLRELSKK